MPGTLASGSSVEVFDTLDSTSLEAKRRVAAGAVGPLWIIALKQTGGYGRRGSAWTQEEGDVAATFLFEPRAAPERLPELSFVAALAVWDAVRRYAPGADIEVKWPNDILVGGGKIAGLLLELITSPNGPLIALGVGVNVVSEPKNLAYPAARLIDWAKSAPEPRRFVETLDESFAAWLAIWRREGFSAIREAWLQRANGLGERIKVRLENETIEGEFVDLDLSGALILECAGERRAIAAGAVLPPAA